MIEMLCIQILVFLHVLHNYLWIFLSFLQHPVRFQLKLQHVPNSQIC